MIGATGLATTGDLDREHPAGDARPELADRDVVLGVARKAGIEDALHAVLTFEPGRQCRRGLRVALDADGQGQDPAQDEERIERADGGARVDLDLLDLPDEVASGRRRRPAITSLCPDRNFVADSTTRSAPSSSGRQTYGEANVLSTMYVAPCSWARRATVAWSVTTVVGLAIVSA